jgi:threonylcarbamoyladenosine tRNA methylthiotransferase MtaB
VKYSVITFGCRVNQADSLGFEEELIASGARPSPPDDADLVVVNTCSVTASADQGARQTIRRIARDNPTTRIVVTGCYATRRPEEVAALPNVVRVVPNGSKPRLVPLLRRPTWSDNEDALEVTSGQRFGSGDGSCGAQIEPGVAGRTSFALRVQTGCNEPCAYCIIPSTRGESTSVSPAAVLAQLERAADAGFREIAITGVHLGAYGRDLAPGTSLTTLLHDASFVARRRDLRLRVSSLEPGDCSSEIIRLVGAGDHFAAHFHLPLQHASNRVLRTMRRPYTIEYYRSLVNDIRRRIPHASIGSDVIVGFPGETDADADELAAYLDGSPLTHVHVFPYSDRPGTAAAMMPNKVPGGVIRERARRLRDISRRLANAFLASQVGTSHRALTLEDGSLAVTGNYLKVRITPVHGRNHWVRVRLTSDHDGELLSG